MTAQPDITHLARDPYSWYRAMAQVPGPRYDATGDTWGVFRYAELVDALRDPDTFSNHAPATASEMLSSTVILRDAPRHRALRQSIVGWFSSKAVSRLEQRIRDVTAQLVDDVAAQGGGDFVRDIAIPLPIIVMADVLGVPGEDFRLFKEWCDGASSNGLPADDGSLHFDRETFVRSREAWGADEVIDYFERLAVLRRGEPRDDLLSALATAEIDSRLLTPRELAASCFQVLLAGNETTTNLMGNTLLCLDSHPGTWSQLSTTPALIVSMLEEVLRYRSSVHGVVRRVTRDVTFHGIDLPEDALVMLWLASGNRDESMFDRPDEFDIQRTPNRHLAFGQGVHFCAGSSLARLESRIVFETLTERFSEMAVTADHSTLDPLASITLSGVKALPVTVTAR